MRVLRTQILLLVLAVTGVALGSVLVSPSYAGVERIKPSHITRHGSLVIYRQVRLASPAVRSAVIKRGTKRKRIPTVRVRRAAGNGTKLTVRVPQRWVRKTAKRSGRKAMIRKRKRIARSANLLVKLAPARAGRKPGTPQVTEPIPPSELKIGLVSNAQGWDMNAAHVLDQSAPTGTRWLREDMDWEVIEPRNDEWHWERYDNLFAEAAARGIRILPVLMSTPEWAGSAWNEIPANPAEFAEMAAQVAARYGPGGTYWEANPSIAGFAPEQFEIWNEPYLDYFSAGGVDAGRYARLVKAASQAAKKANPAAGIMLAADYSPSGKPSHTFIEDMYGAVPDLNEHFDSVAVHPYSGDSSPTDPRGGWGFPRIQTIRDKLVSFGGADKHLWITEIGWSTCPKPTGSYCVSESQQASYTAQLFELLQTKYSSYVDAVFLYRREDMNDNPSDKEGWFGMVRLDGSEKPVYDVFRRAVGAA